MRRTAFLLTFAVVGACGSARANSILYNVTPINGFFTAINDAGQVVGQSGGVAAAYSNGTITHLTANGSLATAINDSGDITGEYDSSGRSTGFLYSGGTLTSFPFSAGGQGSGFGINDYGEVVGYAEVFDANSSPQYFDDAFTETGGVMNVQSLFFGAAAFTGINDAGQIVGVNTSGQAFLDTNGQITLLGAESVFNNVEGPRINSSGQVTVTLVTGTSRTAYLYDSGVLTPIGASGNSQVLMTLGKRWARPEGTRLFIPQVYSQTLTQ